MSFKQKILLGASVAAIALCLVGIANAQTVQKSVKVNWTNPTTYFDGTAMPAGTVTKIQVFMAAAPIADTSTMAPTAELTATATTTTQTVTAGLGGKVHVRLKACAVSLCSDFSAPTSVDVPAVLKPGVPTSVTIELILQ